MKAGHVYLVGAGPGDPGLMTVRGQACLAQADAIVYDRLVSPRLLQMAPPGADLYYVGKASSEHTVPQDEITALLVKLGLEGKVVVRLKGGDPFVFGRGGEEALGLRAAGVPWEVVPGISSAISVPAYAGIPVTHRALSPHFTVVTGHQCIASEPVVWDRLSASDGTLVILMGVNHLSDIIDVLLRTGRTTHTPIALIRWGTTASQEVVSGTLATIVELVAARGFKAPAIIVVGDVVTLRDELDWVATRPFAGQRMIVAADTVEDAQAAESQLCAWGAEVFPVATERLVIPQEETLARIVQQLTAKRADVPRIKGIQFTSAVGVTVFFAYWSHRGLDLRALYGVHIGAASRSVARALRRHGITADSEGAWPTGSEGSGIVLREKMIADHNHPVRLEGSGVRDPDAIDFRDVSWYTVRVGVAEGLLPWLRQWHGDGAQSVWVTSLDAYALLERQLQDIREAMPPVYSDSEDTVQSLRNRGIDATWVADVTSPRTDPTPLRQVQ